MLLNTYIFLAFIICLNLQKNKNSTSERSFATGTIAETMEKFDSPMANELTPEIIPKILELTQLVILASNFLFDFVAFKNNSTNSTILLSAILLLKMYKISFLSRNVFKPTS